MRKRLAELNRAGQNVHKIMMEVAEGATIEAVRVAEENTPPNGGADIAGTNMRSGDMANHWQTDRVDKHFVPGLIVNGDLLEKSPDGSGGIMVGTKTTYVKGKYMKQKAVGKYRAVVRKELDKRVREAFR